MEEPLDFAEVAVACYRRFGQLAVGATDVDIDRPTRLTGWAVRDLLAHVAWGQAVEADAVRRRGPDPRTGSAPEVAANLSQNELLAAVDDGFAAFTAALADAAEAPALSAESTLVALPAGVLPAGAALALFAVEAGLHASDLAEALGEADALEPEVIAACVAIADPLLDLGARVGTRPDAPVVVELRGESVSLIRAWCEGEWRDTCEATTTLIAGSDEQIVRFLYGRGDWRTLGLAVTGDEVGADRFKEWFPGP